MLRRIAFSSSGTTAPVIRLGPQIKHVLCQACLVVFVVCLVMEVVGVCAERSDTGIRTPTMATASQQPWGSCVVPVSTYALPQVPPLVPHSLIVFFSCPSIANILKRAARGLLPSSESHRSPRLLCDLPYLLILHLIANSFCSQFVFEVKYKLHQSPYRLSACRRR